MKNQPGKIEGFLTTVLAFVFAFGLVALVTVARGVLWPLLKFIAKLAFKGIKKFFIAIRMKKKTKKVSELPTPDIFKGAQNLAPAKEVQL